jgi:hypothetical protein
MADNDFEVDDDFWDKVGEDNDPKKVFGKALKNCGAIFTETEDGYIRVENSCPNLVMHKDENFMEIFCTKCSVSVSVSDIRNLSGEDLGLDDTDVSENVTSEAKDGESDDLDEFLGLVEKGDDNIF